MRTRLRSDLPVAIKARDAVAIAALRGALAVIENAEAVEVPAAPHVTGSQYVAGAVSGQAAEVERRELTGTDERELVQSQVDQRTIAAKSTKSWDARTPLTGCGQRRTCSAAICNLPPPAMVSSGLAAPPSLWAWRWRDPSSLDG